MLVCITCSKFILLKVPHTLDASGEQVGGWSLTQLTTQFITTADLSVVAGQAQASLVWAECIDLIGGYTEWARKRKSGDRSFLRWRKVFGITTTTVGTGESPPYVGGVVMVY